MHSQAMMAQPAMRAQREGGSERTAVVNLGQADLMGDGIDYTVGGAWGESPGAGKCKGGTVLEPGTSGQPSAAVSAAFSARRCEIQRLWRARCALTSGTDDIEALRWVITK